MSQAEMVNPCWIKMKDMSANDIMGEGIVRHDDYP